MKKILWENVIHNLVAPNPKLLAAESGSVEIVSPNNPVPQQTSEVFINFSDLN